MTDHRPSALPSNPRKSGSMRPGPTWNLLPVETQKPNSTWLPKFLFPRGLRIPSWGNGWLHEGIGGIHHLAYQVESVDATMNHWKEKGYAEFTTAKPLTCPGLTQCFTKPSVLTGVIYEFIERRGPWILQGQCEKSLMESTSKIG